MGFDFEKYEDGANSVTNVVRTSKVEAEFKLAQEAFNLGLVSFKEAKKCFTVKTKDKTEIESKLTEGLAKFLSAKGAQSLCDEIKERAIDEIKELKKVLEEGFPKALNDFKKKMAKTKLAMVIHTHQLKKDFSALQKTYSESGVKLDAGPVDTFLKSMESIDLLQLEDSHEKRIVEEFKGVTRAQRNFFGALANKAKEEAKMPGGGFFAGLYNAFLDGQMLEAGMDNSDFLDKAVKDYSDLVDLLSEQSQKKLEEFLKNAVKKSGRMKNLVEAIIDNELAKNLEAEIKKFTDLNLGKLDRLKFECELELRTLLNEYEKSGGNYRDYAEQISGTEIPKFLPIIDKVYAKGQLGFVNFAKKLGKRAKLERTFQFKKEFNKKFEYRQTIPAPITTGAIVTRARFILSAKLEAAADIDSVFNSHNFLDSEEKRYLSVTFDGSCELKKENTLVSAGLELTFFELFQSTGTAILATQSSAKISAKTVIKKSDRVATFAAFKFTSTGEVLMELKGKLTLNITVTPHLANLFKSLGLPRPDKTFESTEITFIKATRKADMKYEFPFAYQKLEVPINTYELNTGDWDISYPAADQLTKQIKDFFGITDVSFSESLQKAREMIQSTPLTEEEKEELMKKYAPELIES